MIQIIRTTFILLFFSLKVISAFAQKDNKPVITGQTPSPLSTTQGTPIAIEFANLLVTDPDPEPLYPDGFSIELSNGKDYKAQGNIVTPDPGFSGLLVVDVRVSDGKNKSDKFELQINVEKTQNEAPVITGQQELKVDEDGSLTLELGNLIVNDPDNNYPQDFSLQVFTGNNYTINGTTITPSPGFSGPLRVAVSVNDGQNESNRYNLKIDVVKKKNTAPVITGQQSLRINEGESLAIELSNLIVEDPDSSFPQDFSLKLFGGKDYTFNGTTVTPRTGFSGELTVPVTVNDGQNESKRFDLKVEVVKKQSVAPQITGQQSLSVNQGSILTLAFGDLTVTDPDNSYPTGFTLKVFPGTNYSFSGTTITPSPEFTGQLTVPVTVNDGQNESNRFDLKVDIVKEQNVAPQITGQQSLSVNQGTILTLALGDLTVTDPDNSYPTGFTLKVFPGTNYSFSGTTITPSPEFTGQLTVPVTVNDGQNESNRFDLKVDVVKKQNVAPQITGQQPLSMNQGASLTLDLAHLTVIDPDNNYPAGFTLKTSPGSNYTAVGNTITPNANFTGSLTVLVLVNDGQNESNTFSLTIEVIKTQNVAPQITGQVELKVNEDGAITLTLDQLQATDSDNTYPQGFSLKVGQGSNYQASGATITPAPNFAGALTVPVIVNDGSNDSAPYDLKITVLPVNDAPVINGQNPLSTNKNTLVSIPLSTLNVSDPDNNYPADFSLNVLSGDNYSIAGNIISPATEFVGILNVVVTVNDGKANSLPFNLKIDVVSPANAAPTITGQRQVRTGQGMPVTIQLSQLIVADPDNTFPQGFTLKLSPGNDYTVTGNTITPAASIVNGTFTVTVKVNDGKDDSNPFALKIEVIPPSAKPRIISQRELSMPEDSTLTISLADLVVTDSDNPNYPAGFVLTVSPSKETTYSRSGYSITPSRNLTGFIEVGVMVSDGQNMSDEFKLAIFVSPVNDPPEFVRADTTSLAYDPGRDPLSIFENINIQDVDDDHLVLAEVGFEGGNYDPANDQFIIPTEHSTVRAVYDSAGRLFLIGYATLDDYLDILRQVQYNYLLTEDENGNTMDIKRGTRIVYLTVSDGHLASSTIRRKVSMDLQISLDVPNAFSPNGDRQNDTWHIDILNADKVNGARLQVYDKRGVIIYESVDLNKDWDGVFNGRMLPVDTYYYTIDLDLFYTKKVYRGTVVLLY